MSLGKLVNFKNLIDAMSTADAHFEINQELKKILYLVENAPEELDDFSPKFNQHLQEINLAIENFEKDLTAFKHTIKDTVTEVEKPWFAKSYRLYEQEMGNETLQDIKFRIPEISNDVKDFFHSRIARYQGWQYPAMIVRPGYESFIDSMVSCDPLYLVDVKHELFEPVLERYNQIYQNRLRIYAVQENDNKEILARLPAQQFGLILAYNFFNFRPFEIIKKYLQELFDKLKPGGTLIMTFNDCDRDKAVNLVERNFCCYTPGYLIEDLTNVLGYELIFKWHNDGPSTWLELRKPGTFTTLRGGQALAKILPKPIA